ncbi:MAG: hypothetical protein E7618_03295 [Ruminococcaceae bacterium]|nr:hypothetical protein [Oscillospiraceae bacterium]
MTRINKRCRWLLWLLTAVLALSLFACSEENAGEWDGSTETDRVSEDNPFNQVASERYAVLGVNLYRLTYNAEGQLLGEYTPDFNYPDFSPAENGYVYDENGRLSAYYLNAAPLPVVWEENGTTARVKGYDRGTCYELVFLYNEQGKLYEKQVIRGEDPFKKTTETYRYDEQGRLFQAGTYTATYEDGECQTTVTSGNRSYTLRLKLNAAGRPSSLYEATIDLDRFVWQYDETGRLIGSEGYSPINLWKNKAYTTLTYDENGRRATVELRVAEGNPDIQILKDITYEYGDDGALKTETTNTQDANDKRNVEIISYYSDSRVVSSEQTRYQYQAPEGAKIKLFHWRTEYDAFGDPITGQSEQYSADGSIKQKQSYTTAYDDLRRNVETVREIYNADGTLENREGTYSIYHEDGYFWKSVETQEHNVEYHGGATSETTEYSREGEVCGILFECEYVDEDGIRHKFYDNTTYKRRDVPLHSEYKCWLDGEIAAESVTDYFYAEEAHGMWSRYTEQATYYENYNLLWYDKAEKNVYAFDSQTGGERTMDQQVYVGGVLRSEIHEKRRSGKSIVDGVTIMPQTYYEDIKTYDENGVYLGREVMEHTYDEKGHRLKTDGSLYAADGTHQRDYVILYDEEGYFVSSTK